MNLQLYSFAVICWIKEDCLWGSLNSVDKSCMLRLVRLKSMNAGYFVVLWGGESAKLELGYGIIGSPHPEKDHSFGDALQRSQVASVDVCLCWAVEQRQSEYTSIKLILTAE